MAITGLSGKRYHKYPQKKKKRSNNFLHALGTFLNFFTGTFQTTLSEVRGRSSTYSTVEAGNQKVEERPPDKVVWIAHQKV
jgi:hypothetical protein